jgi:WhiB family transcriptional regulator, redox-sensing transcriptional regulator
MIVGPASNSPFHPPRYPVEPEEWMDQAECVGADPDLFFPERGEDSRTAKEICYRCPVRQKCLEYAMKHGEKYGIWGGKSERERRQIRMQLRRIA